MTTIQHEHCRVCGSDMLSQMLSDCTSLTGRSYALVRCDECGFVSLAPLPSTEDLKMSYDENYWQAGGIQHKGSLLEMLFRLRMISVIKEMKDILPANAKVMDWGAGDGAFLSLLMQNGFNCWGIDLYNRPPEESRFISSTIENADFPDEYFDAITCFHVLEHLADPVSSVRSALRLIKRGGYLILEVPNISSLGYALFQRRWQPLEVPTHLNHFNLHSLRRLLGVVGNCELTRIGYFSSRVSPSALVLSLFPSLNPKRVRKSHGGHNPLYILFIYLILQICAFPFAALESAIHKGAIVRVCVKKLM